MFVVGMIFGAAFTAAVIASVRRGLIAYYDKRLEELHQENFRLFKRELDLSLALRREQERRRRSREDADWWSGEADAPAARDEAWGGCSPGAEKDPADWWKETE